MNIIGTMRDAHHTKHTTERDEIDQVGTATHDAQKTPSICRYDNLFGTQYAIMLGVV